MLIQIPVITTSGASSLFARSLRRKNIPCTLSESIQGKSERQIMISPPQVALTPDEMGAAAFAGPLYEYVHGVLTESGGFALEFFGRKGVEQLLEENRSRKINRFILLGMLMTAERYRKMVGKVTLGAL